MRSGWIRLPEEPCAKIEVLPKSLDSRNSFDTFGHLGTGLSIMDTSGNFFDIFEQFWSLMGTLDTFGKAWELLWTICTVWIVLGTYGHWTVGTLVQFGRSWTLIPCTSGHLWIVWAILDTLHTFDILSSFRHFWTFLDRFWHFWTQNSSDKLDT